MVRSIGRFVPCKRTDTTLLTGAGPADDKQRIVRSQQGGLEIGNRSNVMECNGPVSDVRGFVMLGAASLGAISQRRRETPIAGGIAGGIGSPVITAVECPRRIRDSVMNSVNLQAAARSDAGKGTLGDTVERALATDWRLARHNELEGYVRLMATFYEDDGKLDETDDWEKSWVGVAAAENPDKSLQPTAGPVLTAGMGKGSVST